MQGAITTSFKSSYAGISGATFKPIIRKDGTPMCQYPDGEARDRREGHVGQYFEVTFPNDSGEGEVVRCCARLVQENPIEPGAPLMDPETKKPKFFFWELYVDKHKMIRHFRLEGNPDEQTISRNEARGTRHSDLYLKKGWRFATVADVLAAEETAAANTKRQQEERESRDPRLSLTALKETLANAFKGSDGAKQALAAIESRLAGVEKAQKARA